MITFPSNVDSSTVEVSSKYKLKSFTVASDATVIPGRSPINQGISQLDCAFTKFMASKSRMLIMVVCLYLISLELRTFGIRQ